jgi:hypothetical protein
MVRVLLLAWTARAAKADSAIPPAVVALIVDDEPPAQLDELASDDVLDDLEVDGTE